jgi:hypothetical protein
MAENQTIQFVNGAATIKMFEIGMYNDQKPEFMILMIRNSLRNGIRNCIMYNDYIHLYTIIGMFKMSIPLIRNTRRVAVVNSVHIQEIFTEETVLDFSPKKHHHFGLKETFDYGHNSKELRLVSAIALGLPYQLDS